MHACFRLPFFGALVHATISRDQKGQACGKHALDLCLRVVIVFLLSLPLVSQVMLEETDALPRKKKKGGYFLRISNTNR
jgi:hypothetical protein